MKEKNHVQLMFRLTPQPQPQQQKADPQTISGPERYRACIEKNRAFGAAIMAMQKLEQSPPKPPQGPEPEQE